MHRWSRSTESRGGPPRRRDRPAIVGPQEVVDPERGAAALEFIVVGLILLVPLVYLVLALGAIQIQSLGAEAGARHVARVVARSADADAARAGADRVLTAVVEEYGLDPSTVELDFDCTPAGVRCPEAGTTLIVRLRAAVVLPLVPPVLGLDRIARVSVEATAAQKVSRFRGSE